MVVKHKKETKRVKKRPTSTVQQNILNLRKSQRLSRAHDKTKLDQKIKKAADSGPVWKGPEVDGVSQSMISRYLVCKERFRVYAIEGWAPNDSLRIPIEYGQMWHTCEEEFARTKGQDDNWQRALVEYCKKLVNRYRLPNEKEQIEKFYNACKVQFPIYADWWSKHPDVKERTPLLQEQVFNVPYTLPSGRVVRLKGKWDSVDLIGRGKKAGIYLQENKTKGKIDEEYLRRQLTFDLQTMTYLIALVAALREGHLCDTRLGGCSRDEIKGVRYNVVRRPLSGGKGNIKQHQPTKSNPKGESKEDYYNRLREYFTDDPKYWFMRWKVEITSEDIQHFKNQFLDPCLEEMCLWYDYQTRRNFSLDKIESLFMPAHFLHYRLPYGVWNPILEGKGSDVEEYILSGSTAGLRKITNLFPELE